MDAYLTRDAARTLRALACLPAAEAEGFLLGHRRGGRVIIEKALPTEKGFFPSVGSFIRADDVLGSSVMGFFSFNLRQDRLKKILAPFACGLIFLDASSFKSKSPKPRAPKAYVIEFDRAFKLRPAAVVVEKDGPHE